MINLPNLLTLGNLVCGCLATLALFDGQTTHVIGFFMASLLFDLLDGMVARILKISSTLGAELDSLADVVAFGVFPGMVLFSLLTEANTSGSSVLIPTGFGFIYSAAAALRLARFNVDDRQTVDFIGLNTPSAAIAIVGLYLVAQGYDCDMKLAGLTGSPIALLGVGLFLSVMLLIELPMLSMKPALQDRRRTLHQTILILGGIILFIWLGTCGIPFLILWYIIYSFIRFVVNKYHS